MADLLTDLIKYMQSLPPTNQICQAVTATMGFNKNFFIGVEPRGAPITAITFYPTGGYGIGKTDWGYRPTIQTRVRCKNWKSGYDISNALIQDFHRNEKMTASTNSKCFCIQSHPNYLGPTEDLEGFLFSANFYFLAVRYDKITK